MTRNMNISQEEVTRAWTLVKASGGGSGADNQSLKDFESNLDNNLYKLWNRLSSGSYMAQPVLLVDIPKVSGGKRTLGIPTVTDRIAQQVIKQKLEPTLEAHFHEDSYGYRPKRSAEMALTAVRSRSFRGLWIIDLDLKSYFDTINHDTLMEILQSYTKEKEILVYARRFLEAKGIKSNGEAVTRTCGTPQGGVISPLLANLYLDEAFDKWMEEKMGVPFTRYADDIIVHCVSEKQAHYILSRIKSRLQSFGLRVNEEKTKIVYAGKGKEKHYRKKFVFLGYTFKSRKYKGQTVFTPAFDMEALKMIRAKVQMWKLHSQTQTTMGHIAKQYNREIRGWIQYYGMFRPSCLYKLEDFIDGVLVKWLRKKYKLGRGKAWIKLKQIKRDYPKAFCHWYMIKERTVRAV